MLNLFCRLIGVVIALALCVAGAHADVVADFKAASAAYDKRQYAEAERITSEILKSPLNPEGKASVLVLRANARNAQNKFKAALADLNAALPLAAKIDKGIVRLNRMLTQIDLEDGAGAAKDLIVLAGKYPKLLKSVTLTNVFGIGRILLKGEKHDELLELLLALRKGNYRDPDPVTVMDYLHLYLVRELVDHKRAEEAVPVVAEFSQYDVLLELSTQARYASLRATPGISTLLNPQDFPARQLAAAQRRAAQFPKSLKAITYLAESLRLNGRYSEAVKTVQETLANLKRFDKDDDYVSWLKNELAYALQAQGQFDLANAVLEPSLKQDVKKNPSLVNQYINLGAMFLNQGQFQRALDAVAHARGSSSPYGDKLIQMVSACAQFRLGKTSEAQAIYFDMLLKVEDNYSAVTRTALCLKNEDQAAAIVLKRLAKTGEAESMLSDLQICRENPKRPPLARERYASLRRVAMRPDVRAAIAKVGIIIAEPIACGDS